MTAWAGSPVTLFPHVTSSTRRATQYPQTFTSDQPITSHSILNTWSDSSVDLENRSRPFVARLTYRDGIIKIQTVSTRVQGPAEAATAPLEHTQYIKDELVSRHTDQTEETTESTPELQPEHASPDRRRGK